MLESRHVVDFHRDRFDREPTRVACRIATEGTVGLEAQIGGLAEEFEIVERIEITSFSRFHPAGGGKINLTFKESNDPYGDAVEALLRDTGVMKELVAGLEQMFVWPRDLQVEFRDCQEVNAWYDPQAAKVTMCYSLVKMTSEIVCQSEGQGVNTGGGQTPGGQTGGGQLDQGGQFLVGLWGTTIQGQGGQEQALAQLSPDGTYQLRRQGGGLVYGEEGRWQAQLQGQNQIQLVQQPTAAQLCDQNNNCQAQQAQAATITVKVVDQNRISTDGIVWQRQQQ